MTSPRRLARIAGLLYLILAVCGGWAQLYVRASVVVPGEAAETADKLRASASLFRIAFAADLVAFTCFLLVGLVLYSLLKSVNHPIALAMVVINAVSVATGSVNMVNHGGAMLVATGADYMTAFGAERSDALVMLFLDLHDLGYSITHICFGLWLLPLGYLVLKCGYFPKALGVFLMIGCFGYLAHLAIGFLIPGIDDRVGQMPALVGGLSEVAFLLWLLVKGANVHSRDEHVPGRFDRICCVVWLLERFAAVSAHSWASQRCRPARSQSRLVAAEAWPAFN